MLGEKTRTALLGLAFLFFLLLSYIENMLFFQNLSAFFQNQLLAVAMLFMHNILVISLILLGMTFYVNLVILDFFKREKYGRIVLDYPRTFAVVFALIIIFLSILRGVSLIYGEVKVETLPLVLLISAPVGVVEGYGIYLTIKKTLSRNMSIKDLAYIYGIFFIAALIEVGFINLLKAVVS